MTMHAARTRATSPSRSGIGHCCAAHAPDGLRAAMVAASRDESPATHTGTLRPKAIIRDYPLIDELLDARRAIFGGDDQEAVFRGYRSHAYHILNFARQWIEPTGDSDDMLAICAVFHDIAAWPDDNLDYLRPSADQADAYLDAIGKSDWKPAMRLMIESHHKITRYRAEHAYWVEPVRRADWCDVSFNLLRFGLPGAFIREVNAAFPIGAFYPGHVYRVSLKWALRHPLNPMPILRW